MAIATDPLDLLRQTTTQMNTQAAINTSRTPIEDVDIQELLRRNMETVRSVGAVQAPPPVVAPAVSSAEQRSRQQSAARSAEQQRRQRVFDDTLSDLLQAATSPTGSRGFIEQRDARRLAQSMLASGGLTGFEQVSQARDMDLLNRFSADRGAELQAAGANQQALLSARTSTASNLLQGLSGLGQQELASLVAAQADIRRQQIASQSGENQLAALQAQIGQALVTEEDPAMRRTLADVFSVVGGGRPFEPQLVKDAQDNPIGTFDPNTRAFTPLAAPSQDQVQAEADRRTRTPTTRSTAAAGTTTETRGAQTQEMLAKVLAGEELTEQEQRQFRTAITLSR